MTTEELLQSQAETTRQHEIEMFKRWMATATREMQVDCPDCGSRCTASGSIYGSSGIPLRTSATVLGKVILGSGRSGASRPTTVASGS
jgi:hypothetical protein